ncbi:hypothetical protein D3C73_609970 [compost metagenome]
MVVDRGIAGAQLDRFLKLRHRIVEPAEAIVSPAERIDDIAVIGARIDGRLDHLQAFVQVEVHVDQRIAEIVQNLCLFRVQFQCLAEIGFGFRPFLQALIGNAALEEHRPVALPRHRADDVDGLVVIRGHLLVVLGLGQDAAIGDVAADIGRVGLDQFLQVALGLIDLAGIGKRDAELQFGNPPHRRILGNLLVECDGALRLLQLFGNAAEHDQRIGTLLVERMRDLQVERDHVFRTLAVQRPADGEEHAGCTFGGGRDLLGRLFTLFDALAKRLERSVIGDHAVADRDRIERLLLVARRGFQSRQRHDGAHERIRGGSDRVIIGYGPVEILAGGRGVAGDDRHCTQMVIGKDLEPGGAFQPVDRRDRLFTLAGADIGPAGQKKMRQAVEIVRSLIGKDLPGAVVFTAAQRIQSAHDLRHALDGGVALQRFGFLQPIGKIAVEKKRDHQPFADFQIGRFEIERLAIKRDCGRIIVIDIGRAGSEKRAGKRLHVTRPERRRLLFGRLGVRCGGARHRTEHQACRERDAGKQEMTVCLPHKRAFHESWRVGDASPQECAE